MSEQQKPVWYENKIKRNAEYNKEHTKQIKLVLNKNTEAEMIEHLEKQPNKQGYIKQLILNDMQKEN